MVQHYTVDMELINNWEIWNEGKGISGKRLNDPTIYIELMKIAIEEINRLKAKKSNGPVNIVAFSGFHHQKYWEKVFQQAPGFNVVSSHIKAMGYQDTYYPARRNDRDQRKKYCRDGWLQTAKEIVQKEGKG